MQEYYELVKREDAYIAVERNVAGSRPKELFEDVLEEADARFEADRSVLKVPPPSLTRWHSVRVLVSPTRAPTSRDEC